MSNAGNEVAHHNVRVLAVVAVGGIITQTQPCCDMLLLGRVISLSLREIGVDTVSFLSFAILVVWANAVLRAEVPQVRFERATSDDRRRILIPIVEQVLDHPRKTANTVPWITSETVSR